MTIRRKYTDFVVRERLSPAFTSSLRRRPPHGRCHAVYEVRKAGMTTPEAIQRFARAVGANSGDVDYAGLKDKHAVTTQHVSLPAAALGGPDAAPAQILEWGGEARLRGFSPTPMTADAIDGNAFTIVVRALSPEACAEMDRRAALLTLDEWRDAPPGDSAHADGPADEPVHPARGPRRLLVMNYFGDQRFGSARHGQGWVAEALIRGDYEAALRLAIATPSRKDSGATRTFTREAANHWGQWERLAATLPRLPERRAFETLAASADGGAATVDHFRAAFASLPYFLQGMYVEAFQSRLWNDTARRLAFTVGGGKSGVIRAPGEYGELVFPHAARADAPWRGVTIPTFGKRTVLAEPWADAAAQALREAGVELKDLRAPGLRRPFFGVAERPLFVVAEGFTLSDPAPDEEFAGAYDAAAPGALRRTAAFALPRGAYATVVLKALGEG